MSSSFGKTIQVSTFGASHGYAIGGVVDGLPCGHTIDIEELQRFLKRRAPGQNQLQTQRKEADVPEFLSGLVDGMLSGSPLAFMIRNTSQHSSDYNNLRDIPRPSHADFTARMRYGDKVDMRGGGHFSARLTAPLCVAGGIALQLLREKGIHIHGHLKQVGPITDAPIDMVNPDMKALAAIAEEPIAMIDSEQRQAVEALVMNLKKDGNSTGGIVEVVATGLPIGLGNPNFDGIENRLARVIFGVPAIKGISFGGGFDMCSAFGSDVNDAFTMDNGRITTTTNYSGGIQGGITNGLPLIMQVGIKPTPSIYKEQHSVSLSQQEDTMLVIKGRHDPCVALRAVPVIEAVTALVILDFLGDIDHELR
ncbi:chorismate synthase [Veillonella agrestimuris]|uniref:chorismate synthase n=1 Tax=Veillonella agrestimuris TaxID=2941340 RepID=UPI00203A9DC7|nr:chorismate synthase [Veillonella agrestimuris]